MSQHKHKHKKDKKHKHKKKKKKKKKDTGERRRGSEVLAAAPVGRDVYDVADGMARSAQDDAAG